MAKCIMKLDVLVIALALALFVGLPSVVSVQQQGGQQGDQTNKDNHGKQDQNEDINDDRQDGPNDQLQEGPNDERNDDRGMDKAEGQNAKQEVADSKHESANLKHDAVFGHKHEADNRNHEGAAQVTAAGDKNEKDVENDRTQDQQQDREQDEQQGAASEPPSGL